MRQKTRKVIKMMIRKEYGVPTSLPPHEPSSHSKSSIADTKPASPFRPSRLFSSSARIDLIRPESGGQVWRGDVGRKWKITSNKILLATWAAGPVYDGPWPRPCLPPWLPGRRGPGWSCGWSYRPRTYPWVLCQVQQSFKMSVLTHQVLEPWPKPHPHRTSILYWPWTYPRLPSKTPSLGKIPKKEKSEVGAE